MHLIANNRKKEWRRLAQREIGMLLVLALLVSVTACGRVENDRSEGVEEDRKIQIGMSFDSFVIERWQRDRDVFVSVAKELGAEVNVQNANGDVEEQKKQIDYFIQKGMDVIVIICIDSDALQESVKKAKNAGIKIVAYDRLIKNADIDLYISFDNAMVGTMMAQALIDEGIAGGNVLMLGGSPTDSNVPMVENAFRQIMDDNNVTILDSAHAEGWKAELAAAYIYNHGSVLSETDAIMCGNDDLATQAVRALSENRMAGDILVVGQDADLAACQRIVEGTQVMTVYKPVERLATRAAQASVTLARGEELKAGDIIVLENGGYEVSYIGLEPVSVNRDNINEVIIGSGFHLKEDVYLNVPEMMPQ